MARILENEKGRRTIVLTTDDVLALVKEYQAITNGLHSYDEIRTALNNNKLFLPEEIV